jgi:hypothetical protein
MTARIAARGAGNALDLPEGVLDAPKASGSECRFF